MILLMWHESQIEVFEMHKIYMHPTRVHPTCAHTHVRIQNVINVAI